MIFSYSETSFLALCLLSPPKTRFLYVAHVWKGKSHSWKKDPGGEKHLAGGVVNKELISRTTCVCVFFFFDKKWSEE